MALTEHQQAYLKENVLVNHKRVMNLGRSEITMKGKDDSFFCQDFYVEPNSKAKRVLWLIQLVNLLYVALVVPV